MSKTTHAVVVPAFVKRFPEYEKTIIESRFRDNAINELCHDYDEVIRALEVSRKPPSVGSNYTTFPEDLCRLKRELEHELLRRLPQEHSDSG